MAYLIQKRADGSVEQEWDLRETPLTVGRDEKVDIVLDDNQASREHFVIVPKGGPYAVRDLNSKNGTWLNGQRLEQETNLKTNDVIRAGQTEFVYLAAKAKGLKTIVQEIEAEAKQSGKGYSTMRRELYKKS